MSQTIKDLKKEISELKKDLKAIKLESDRLASENTELLDVIEMRDSRIERLMSSVNSTEDQLRMIKRLLDYAIDGPTAKEMGYEDE